MEKSFEKNNTELTELRKNLKELQAQYEEWEKSHKELVNAYNASLKEKKEPAKRKKILVEKKENTGGDVEKVEKQETKEPLQISVDEIIDEAIAESGAEEIQEELHGKTEEEIRSVVEEAVIADMNDKEIEPTPKQEADGKESILKKVKRKVRQTLLALAVVCNFAASTSFSFKYSDEALAYDNLKVENLKDWNSIKLYEEEINKLDNISIINEFRKDIPGKYLIIDKEMALAHLYEHGDLISTYEVGTGMNKGDEQTETVIHDGKVYWEQGNRQTGAGIYTINKESTYDHLPSFTLVNERGIEVPTVLHKTLPERRKFFNNGNTEDDRMTNGCMNFQANSIKNLANQEGFGPGTNVYVLPDDPHNKFIFTNGELRFVSNEKEVNKTVRPYNPQPIMAKADTINEDGKEFLQTLAEKKQEIMKLYPEVPNSVYNEFVKVAYGIFGQESSFGTYGGFTGQTGRVMDKLGAMLEKNVSAGTTQIRINSINPKVREIFDISKTSDLFDVSKSSIATISHLLDIYSGNIPTNQKDKYRELAVLHYNNPKEFRNVIKNNTKKIQNRYVANVLKYSNSVKIYAANK